MVPWTGSRSCARRTLVLGLAVVVPLAACAVLSLFRESVANTNAALGLVLLVVAAGRESTSALIERVCDQIVDVLQIDRCRFDPGSGPALATLDSDGAMTYNGSPYDVDRLGLPTDSKIALAVRSGGLAHGRLLLTAATRVVRPSREQLRVAGALANQVGAALSASTLNGRPPRGKA